MSSDIADALQHFSEKDTDVIVYSGSIARDGYEKFCKVLDGQKRGKLLLVLSTYGGDPNAGYRIARAAAHHYGVENFGILIPTYCKSAGTLICIGANNLIMADQSELGPLDVQFRKQDELFQQSSGLDILRGVNFLKDEALNSFRSYLIDINGGAVLSTRVASEIASDLVIGLYEPLFAQVDPIKLGEMNAALQIAQHYGERLDKKSHSLKDQALSSLIMAYPTHGFVIDRAEARTLFKHVSAPSVEEGKLCRFFMGSTLAKNTGNESAIVLHANPPTNPTPPEPENAHEPATEPAEAGGLDDIIDAQDDRAAESGAEGHDGESAAHDGKGEHPVGSQQGDELPTESRES
jgi:hypothetical protein